MPLADLVTAFERDARAEVQAILAAGEADAAQLEADAAKARADRIAGSAVTATAARRRDAEARIAEASHRTRAAVLAARAAMLERVHTAVRARLPALVDADLGASLVDAVVACVGNEPGTLRCRPDLAGAARARVPPTLEVVADPEVATGAIVELASTRMDATLETFCDREWPRLACEVLAMERAR